MKKKRLVSFILVLSSLVIAEVISSCSSYFDEEETYGNYTFQEEMEFESLAREYGLSLEIDDTYFGNKLSRKQIENLCKDVSTLLGKYEIVGEKRNDRIELVALNKRSLTSVNVETPSLEKIWSGEGSNENHTLTVAVTLYQNEMSGNFSLGVEAVHIIYGNACISISCTEFLHTGFMISFSTNAILEFSSSLSFSFQITGRYYENLNTGEIEIGDVN